MAKRKNSSSATHPASPRSIAVVGAGMAGIACARTLLQAGYQVDVFEKSRGPGGRMATRRTEFGGFDHGTQYFTLRDERFKKALNTAPGAVVPWQVKTVHIMDEAGRVATASGPDARTHWVAAPGMNSLPRLWAEPLTRLHLQSQVIRIEADKLSSGRWQLQTEGPGADTQIHAGFDAVLLALPSVQAAALLRASGQWPQAQKQLAGVQVAPCWTLMLAFPQASGPLGPTWQAARSVHHRISWLTRETSKPGRGALERWTVQASPAWSERHLEDDEERVKAKLLRAFTEITGIRAQPGHAQVHRWRYAQTIEPLGVSHLWQPQTGLGLCGDWCLGRRVEDAFVSGLELALATASSLAE